MTVSNVRRPDFTNSLVHLTSKRVRVIDASDPLDPKTETIPAFEVLKSILSERAIRGSGNDGFVRGSTPAVCLSEIPLSQVHLLVSDRRYSHYGIAISKKAAFAVGGRPVIYLPPEEAEWIPPEQLWRLVRFEFGKVDFTHEREWRIPEKLDLTALPGFYLLVWDTLEAKEVETICSGLTTLRGVLPMQHLNQML